MTKSLDVTSHNLTYEPQVVDQTFVDLNNKAAGSFCGLLPSSHRKPEAIFDKSQENNGQYTLDRLNDQQSKKTEEHKDVCLAH